MEDNNKNNTSRKDGHRSDNNVFQYLEVPYNRSKEDVWQELSQKLEPQERIPLLKLHRPWYKAAIAAAIIVVAGLSFARFYSTTVHCLAGQHMAHVLPDGSRVQLNAASSISYKPYWWDRDVQLEGEAFFEVKRGAQFTVHSTNGQTTVLGTSFNIYARDNFYHVLCKTGKVRVESKEKKVTLMPDEQAVLDGDELSKSKTSKATQILSWKDNKFYFEGIPLSKVLEELERQYDVEIEYNDLENMKYTGMFSKSAEVEQSLSVICTTFGLEFELVNDEYKIGSN